MEDFKNHLADQVLSEAEIVSLVTFSTNTATTSLTFFRSHTALSAAHSESMSMLLSSMSQKPRRWPPYIQALICT